MLTRFLHKIVANPTVYDLVQRVAGASAVDQHLSTLIAAFPSTDVVLDLGGGTGSGRALWPSASCYVCLDNDPVKLSGYAAKHPGGLAVLCDATRAAIRTGTVDIVICRCMCHHIEDNLLPALLNECLRVLKEGGRFLFFDPIWAPHSWVGRLLWKYDRGSFPRSEAVLRAALSQHGEIVHWGRLAILHQYVSCVVAKPSVSVPPKGNERVLAENAL